MLLNSTKGSLSSNCYLVRRKMRKVPSLSAVTITRVHRSPSSIAPLLLPLPLPPWFVRSDANFSSVGEERFKSTVRLTSVDGW